MLHLPSAQPWQRFGQGSLTATPVFRHVATAQGLLTAPKCPDHRLAAASCLASHGDSFDVVNQKNRHLRSRLASMPWTPLTSFEVAGQSYTLPWKSQQKFLDTDVRCPKNQHENPEYLAGFFDGDGCVQGSHRSGASLTVPQSVDGAEVLLQFAGTFGGRIHRLKDGLGLQKPTMCWAIYGRNARDAASCLAPCSITKRRQLEIIASWPGASACRESCAKELCSLKRYDSSIAGAVSWGYFAGFFDAEGYIEQPNGGNCLVLRIKQKHVTVLECLQSFLDCETGWHGRISKRLRGDSELIIGTTSRCKHILEKMLQAGMFRKADQAELALTLHAQNAAHVRSAMAEMVGNQMFGKRLDENGLQRAREIKAARSRAKRLRQRGLLQAADALFDELDVLKTEHALLQAQHENRQLHEYMHKIESMTP